jgi:hypothetical protein
MGVFSDVLQQISCMLGLHHGGNFCICCGKQLKPEPFSSFRVRSSDGQVDVVLKGLNDHHAKRQLQKYYPSSTLTAQKMRDHRTSERPWRNREDV